MSFFRRKETPQIPPPPPDNTGYDDGPARRPPPDRYTRDTPDRYAAPQPARYVSQQPDRYGEPEPDRYGGGAPAPARYGAAPAQDRYGGPPAQDRYGAPPAQDRYGAPPRAQPDRFGASPQPDRRPSPAPSGGSGYSRSRPVGDPYQRSGGNADADRAALFGGYTPKRGEDGEPVRNRFADEPVTRGNRFTDAELDRRREEGGDEEEDVEAIKTSIKTTKQESLASTRNALRIAREAEETARNTLTRLGDQSERLAEAERHIEVAKWNSVRADDKTGELKSLNRSIFIPSITFNKDAKRAEQERKMLARHESERSERERMQMDVRETQERIGSATAYGSGRMPSGDGGDAPMRGGRYRSEEEERLRKAQRSRYQFEATGSDDELEDELDDNLDAIGGAVATMKQLSLAMGAEVDGQNKRLQKFSDKVDDVDRRVVTNTHKLKNIK